MKKLLSIILLFISLNIFAQENKCVEFKTGTFKYADKTMPYTIIRNDSIQIETSSIDKVEIHSSIEWKSDCEYVLTYLKILNHPKDVSNVIGAKIYVKIIETDGQLVKVHAKSDVMDNEIEFIKIDL